MTDYRDWQRAFFEALFPELEGYIELRGISRNGKPPVRKFFPTVEELVQAIPQTPEAQHGYDIYFGVLPRATTDGTKTGIKLGTTAWVDIDSDPIKAEKAVDSYPLKWTTKTMSGHGVHAFYRLKEPYDLTKPEVVADFEARLRKLATSLNGDLKACDLTRIMRVPGTWNMKEG